jgi:hypothetical protein
VQRKNPCAGVMARGARVRGSCDNGCRLANRVPYFCVVAHFSTSASTLTLDDTGLTELEHRVIKERTESYPPPPPSLSEVHSI